jgi:hypothetical protein
MVIWRHVIDKPQLKNSDQRWIDNKFIPGVQIAVIFIMLYALYALAVGISTNSDWHPGAEKEINNNYVSRVIEWVNDGLFEEEKYSTTHEVKIKKGLPKWLKLWPLVILVMLGYFVVKLLAKRLSDD